MFGLGTPELIVILGIAFLVFGGKKLPEVGEGLGKAISSFKKGIKDAEGVKESASKGILDDVPGVKEVAAIKGKVDEVKNLGKVFSK
ncbi:MAG: twin-arginine translocase TatA/TatE family subunit [Desulfobulbaceae bacterium]|nr:twin-arginine translocase TatA/TatE family subunit [Desulfobulbaceae bacterium]